MQQYANGSIIRIVCFLRNGNPTNMKTKKKPPVKILLSELDKGSYHLFVSVKLNGKRCRFLIDTGASKSVVDKTYFTKNYNPKSLIVVQQATTGLHSSVPESHFGKVKVIELGHKTIRNYVMAAIDLSHVNSVYAQLKKPKIQGILGSDIMLKYKMVVDYGTLQIVIP